MVERINTGGVNRALSSNQVNSFKALTNGMGFEAMLKEQLHSAEGVQFSKHAQKRVEERGIDMTPTLMDSLNTAVEKAREKGAKDIVIIGRSEAFIVNIPNNMVVTTMTDKEMKSNIFTNIDSAIIL